MATRKPDWAQRMVEPYEWHEGIDGGVFATHIRADNAATLLRTHHRKVKRMVQEVIREHRKVMALIGKDSWRDRLPVEGGIEACGDILAKLKELEQ